MINSNGTACAVRRGGRGREVRAVLTAAIAAMPIVSLLGGAGIAGAANQYWDSNGTTPGAGVTPTGTWGVDNFWNDQADGGDGLGAAVIGPWINGSTAVFAAGSDATGSYGVTVSGTQTVAGINVEEGTIAISGGGIEIGSGATIDTAAGTSLTLTSIITGSGGRLVKNGAGTLDFGSTLSLPNTFGGGVTLNGGLTIIPGEASATSPNGNALGAAPAAFTPGYIEINNGATLRSTRVSTTSSFVIPNRGILLGAGGAKLDVADATAVLSYAGQISGTGGFEKIGLGELRLGTTTGVPASDFTGDILVKQGTLSFNSGTLSLGTGTIRTQGGNLAWNAARTLSNPLSVESDVLFSNTPGATSGARTMGFSSNNISGTAGTVRVRNLSTNPNATTPPISVLRFLGGGFDFSRPIVIGDAADLAPSRLEFLTDNPTPAQTFSGVISGPGVIRRTNNVQDTGGDTVLLGANTYSGGTEINGGFVGIGSNSALGTGGVIFGSAGASDDINGLYAVGGARTVSNNLTSGVMTKLAIKGDQPLTIAGTWNLGAQSRFLDIVNTADTTFSNTISGDPGVGIIKREAGTVVFSGSNTYTGPTNVEGGKLVLGASQVSSSNVSISNDAVLQIAATGTGTRVLKTGAVSITGSGKLDLVDNKLITSSPVGTFVGGSYTEISGLVDTARGNAGTPAWDGATGITTSDARAQGKNLVSIGVAKIGQVKGVADGATTTFAGQTVLGSDTVAMVTWGGDATLDGKINIDDYGRIDANVASSGSVFGWYNGDFNYDGAINIDDYGIIDGNIANQGAVFTTSGGAVAVAAAEGVSAVPEPASLSVLALGALGLMRRRR